VHQLVNKYNFDNIKMHVTNVKIITSSFGQRQYSTFQQMLAGLINGGEKVLVCIIAIKISH